MTWPGRALTLNRFDFYIHYDKARASPQLQKVAFAPTSRDGQAITTSCSMSVTLPPLHLHATN